MEIESKETHLLALLYRVEDLIFDIKLDGSKKLEEDLEKLSKVISDLQDKLKTKD